ncbi:LLM class flavin-dependent oxidoreductase [Pararhodobacter sp. CCB-MM2]|uniref:LLM class flavin-dependent oxidoreductase n=1 Tax=Pararhodobacter sp. CCB-MM2 TaxID=1786003 RepID=UPI00082BA8A3|nr:LLM class flavin-dependent oxidoreductase [Pararhodobacter sp. CCB-MM2]MCA2012541.1 LLM class flavin-dependent oxidoreductase [Cereibacter sphaeroides]
MHHVSILDLSPVPEGSTPADALKATVALAQAAERLGYHRFWLAEHHNMPGIASAATAVVIGHVAGATSRIRVGAGGIMLPNHSPLTVAEAFGTLETLYPGRIDLGLGRAPGTDQITMRALRRHMQAEDTFPQDVMELLAYFGENAEARVQAVPGTGTNVPLYILGSSLYGAQLAAYLGLPYAFASHFAPQALDEALAIYRSSFRPSDYLKRPYAIVAAGCFAAETDDEATYLRSSMLQSFARLRSGQPGKLPPPIRDVEAEIPAAIMHQVQGALSFSATGGPETLETQLKGLIARTQPDELILTGAIWDPAKRIRSIEIAAEVVQGLLEPVA